MLNNEIILMEAGKRAKIFTKEEAQQIIDGSLDATLFFNNKEESTIRLNAALKGKPVYPGQKEREEFLEREIKLREEVKAFKLKNNIQDPPEFQAKYFDEVSKNS